MHRRCLPLNKAMMRFQPAIVLVPVTMNLVYVIPCIQKHHLRKPSWPIFVGILSSRPRGPKNWPRPQPWPRWQWPRPRDTTASASCHPASWSRLLQCTDFIFCRNCQFHLNIGNCCCKVSYHRISGVSELYFINYYYYSLLLVICR